MKPGDIVRVRNEAVERTPKDHANRIWVAEHGWLWVLMHEDHDGDWVCKSLATGATQRPEGGTYWFYKSELEQADGKE